jgi:hypothetical protein
VRPARKAKGAQKQLAEFKTAVQPGEMEKKIDAAEDRFTKSAVRGR